MQKKTKDGYASLPPPASGEAERPRGSLERLGDIVKTMPDPVMDVTVEDLEGSEPTTGNKILVAGLMNAEAYLAGRPYTPSNWRGVLVVLQHGHDTQPGLTLGIDQRLRVTMRTLREKIAEEEKLNTQDGRQEQEELKRIDLCLGFVTRQTVLTPSLIQNGSKITDEMLEEAYRKLDEEDCLQAFKVEKRYVQELLAAMYGELQRRHPGKPAKRANPDQRTDVLGLGGRLKSPDTGPITPLDQPPTGDEPARPDEETVIIDPPLERVPMRRWDWRQKSLLVLAGGVLIIFAASVYKTITVPNPVPATRGIHATHRRAATRTVARRAAQANVPVLRHSLPPVKVTPIVRLPVPPVPTVVHPTPPPAPAPVPPAPPPAPAVASDGCLEHLGTYCVLTQPDSHQRFTVRDSAGHRLQCRRVSDLTGRDWRHFPLADLTTSLAIAGAPVTCENLPTGTDLVTTGPGQVDLGACWACAPAH